MGKETLHAYFATWRDEEWMIIELCRFLNHKKDTNFEVLLESFSQYYCERNGIYIEGIEFRAIHDVNNEESVKIEEVQQILESNTDMVQVLQRATHSEEICNGSANDDEGEKALSLNEVNERKHLMLSAKEVLYDSSKVKCVKFFHLNPSEDPRFQKRGKMDGWKLLCGNSTQLLSFGKDYIPMHMKIGMATGESYSKRRNPIAMGKLPVGDDNKLPISTLLIFAALDSEALPIVHHFKLSPDDGSFQNAYGYYVDAIRVVKCVYSFNHHKRYRVQTPLCTHMGMARKMVRNGHVDISVRPSTSQLKTHLPRDFEIEFRRFPLGVPWIRYHGYYKDLNINLIYPGKDRGLGINSVGTVPASLVTYASIQALKPDLFINAGTAGGFKVKGACIFDVFLVSDLAFHDRRIPIPGPDKYGLGRRNSFSTPNLVKDLHLKVCKLSTGDSLDMSPHDETCILANDATIVDMEGAALAYVCSLMRVPAIFIKAVSNFVDGEKSIPEEFAENLQATVVALRDVVAQVVEFINGKSLYEL
ncbi:nucleoside phosphorylase [Tanacetum coccineum]|uniref:Nucleoside phosphorylase n=1 Tax=Tanacetum coccineum TaxID=301880 RepID=A0ABQ5A4Z0_9ASTR